jgi:membrane-associated protease RseP (regulator of RpoE activity)
MSFAVGVTLFALGIAISIALHEAGHLWAAKAFGMRVRRYFIGFGPRIFSFRRGETEYGLKAIPAGGFCDIAGMTALDDVAPHEEERAFYRKPTWQRVIGLVLIYVVAVGWGLVEIRDDAAVGTVSCAADQVSAQEFAPCGPGVPAPAADAGLRPGDVIVSVAGVPIETWEDAVLAIRDARGPTELVVERDGQAVPVVVDVAAAQRLDPQTGAAFTVGAIGVAPVPPTLTDHGVLDGIPATFAYTGGLFVDIAERILELPERIPALFEAIAGGERDENTPVSVIGASIIGGDLAERERWVEFVFLLAVLNFFVGVFNLLPLLPLDGGHIVVNLYERVRDWTRSRLGKPQMPPVDYTKLLPITFGLIIVGGAFSLLVLTADIINPIRLPD